MSLAAANGISMAAAAAIETVLSERDGTFVGFRFSWLKSSLCVVFQTRFAENYLYTLGAQLLSPPLLPTGSLKVLLAFSI